MRILIHDDGIQVAEPDVFTALSMRLVGISHSRAESVLSDTGFGRFEGTNHAWVSVEKLRAAAEPDDARADSGSNWASGWAKMIDYAAKNGWMEGETVRVHLDSST